MKVFGAGRSFMMSVVHGVGRGWCCPAVLAPTETLPIKVFFNLNDFMMTLNQAEIFSRLGSPCLVCPHHRGRQDHSPHLSFCFSETEEKVTSSQALRYISLVYLKFFGHRGCYSRDSSPRHGIHVSQEGQCLSCTCEEKSKM